MPGDEQAADGGKSVRNRGPSGGNSRRNQAALSRERSDSDDHTDKFDSGAEYHTVKSKKSRKESATPNLQDKGKQKLKRLRSSEKSDLDNPPGANPKANYHNIVNQTFKQMYLKNKKRAVNLASKEKSQSPQVQIMKGTREMQKTINQG